MRGLEQRVAVLRAVCVAETVSFVALLVAMIAGSEGGVSVLGMAHGLLFLAYVALVLLTFRPLGWPPVYAIGVIATGPIGAVVAFERLQRERAVERARSGVSA